MYLIGHTSNIVPAKDVPSRKEDPFSAMANELFVQLLEDIRKRRGADVRLAITFANCFGGWTFCEPQAKYLLERGPGKVSAFLSVAWFPAAAQGQVTIKNQLPIPALTFSTEFFAFHDALTIGRQWLELGLCDVVLAGAAETVGSPFLVEALGPGAVNDVALWFVLAADGDGSDWLVRLHASPPPVLEAVEVTGQNFQGSPLAGSCALPLLLLAAMRNAPCALQVPDRVVLRADKRCLELWR